MTEGGSIGIIKHAIVVHLSARSQFLALATALHRRCGASSPARLLADQPTLVRQLWDSLWFPTATRTWGVISSLHEVTLSPVGTYTIDTTLTTFSASGILGGVVANGPGYMWTNDVCSRSQTCVIGPSSCSSADGGDGRSAIHVVEALRTKSRQGTGYWMSTMTETGPRAQLLFHDDCSYSIHAVNSKWFLIGDQCKTGFEVFRLWDRITGRRRIRDTEPSRFIFNKSNEDEAVVLASGPIFVVIDVAQSFSEGTAKVLSETKWKKPRSLGFVIKLLVFNSTHSDDGRSPRSFIVLVESNADFSSKLFTVEETTGNFKKLSNRVLGLSQLNETTFCVSLPTEYQLWGVSTSNTAVPMRSFPLGVAGVVTAECGFLFHPSQDGTVINVTDATTGNIMVSIFNLPPKSRSSFFGFVV